MAQKKAQEEGQGGVDLSLYDVASNAEEGVWFEPVGPAGTPLECRILVYGEDSQQYAKAMNRVADMRADRQRTRRRADTNWDDIQAAELILARYLTADWENIVEAGEPLECTDENKRKVYKKYRWLAEQVLVFARDRGNFINP